MNLEQEKCLEDYRRWYSGCFQRGPDDSGNDGHEINDEGKYREIDDLDAIQDRIFNDFHLDLVFLEVHERYAGGSCNEAEYKKIEKVLLPLFSYRALNYNDAISIQEWKRRMNEIKSEVLSVFSKEAPKLDKETLTIQ